ncbi:MAG TPA: anti-sigma factor [Mycobacteriales bacterium]|nr:anti-sigma factor [Mycobacteriales bacterium]
MVAVASASVRSAARFAPEVITQSEVVLPDPSRLLAEITGGGVGTEAGSLLTRSEDANQWGVPVQRSELDGWAEGASESAPGNAPATGAATARAPTRDRRLAGARQPSRRGWWSAAAAAVLLVGGIGAATLIHRPGPDGSAREVAMRPVGTWTATGTVTMRGSTMTIDAHNLNAAPRGRFYEVWLINGGAGTPKLLPVGVLTPSTSNQYVLSDSLVSGYTTVEISYEKDDGNPAYSGDSVMTARYG